MWIVLIILLILMFSGGGYYGYGAWGPRYGYGLGGVGFILLLALIFWFLAGAHP